MSKRHRKTIVLGLLIFFVFASSNLVVSAAETYAITVSRPLWKATYQYLNEMCIEKAPELALRVRYGSETDREILKKVSEIITREASTDEEKAVAIAKWVGEYITYETNGVRYFPIDVLYDRKGNCLGEALLMTELMRIQGIPAVSVAGGRGDMESVITVDEMKPDHGWVMAYINGDWSLFDPLFDVYGCNDREYLAKWYYVYHVEGIMPFSKEVDYNIFQPGYGTMYMDGRTMMCLNGRVVEECMESMAALNGCVSYMAKNRYYNANGVQDGFHYFDMPERRDELLLSETYHGGWIYYSDETVKYFAQENGILLANSIYERNGVSYFLSYDGSALVIPDEKKECTLTEGFITYKLHKTEKLPLSESVIKMIDNGGEMLDGRGKLVFEVLDPDMAVIDENGYITGLKEGLCTICAKQRAYDFDGWYLSFFIQVYFTNEERTLDYDSILSGEDDNDSDSGEVPTIPFTIPESKAGNLVASNAEGFRFYEDENGDKRCYKSNGEPVVNDFICDGIYTYYFQLDGTCMKNRLTYHPDGEHVIYFDENGHEVFSTFANVKKTIAGEPVDDYCFFDVFGYLYVDVVTYDQTGTKLYYANEYGVMTKNSWFRFSDNVKWADGTPFDKAGGSYGYTQADGTLLTNTYTYNWQGSLCYLQGNGVAIIVEE